MNKKTIAYILLGILIFGLILATAFPGMIHAIKDSQATGNSIEDKCSPAPGYTEEDWREHMSHHPDIYKECLG
jgi:hypothetical protein